MNIKMTIEVSTEIAEKVIALLRASDRAPAETRVGKPISNPQTSNANTPTVPVTAPTYQTPVSQSIPVTAPVQNPVPVYQAAPTAAPISTHTYTIDQLQTAIAPLLDAGKVAQLQQLVQSFGVNTLMEIPKERYGEFANGIRQLGGVL